MPILQKLAPTASYRAWEVIGRLETMLVQRRTEDGLQSNRTLYHRLMYRNTDHAPFRIVLSEDPADFEPFGGVINASFEKKGKTHNAKKFKRYVVATAKDRKDILLDWDLLKTARSDMPGPVTAANWPLVYSQARILQAELQAESIIKNSVERQEEEDDESASSEGIASTLDSESVTSELYPSQHDHTDSLQDMDGGDNEFNNGDGEEDASQKNKFKNKKQKYIPLAIGAIVLVVALFVSLTTTEAPIMSSIVSAIVTAAVSASVVYIMLKDTMSTEESPKQRKTSRRSLLETRRQQQSTTVHKTITRISRLQSAETQDGSSAHPQAVASTEGAVTKGVLSSTAAPAVTAAEPPRKFSVQFAQLKQDGTTEGVFSPNNAPIPIETPYFQGEIYCKLCTTPPDPRLVPYFSGKKRKFEIQIQGKLTLPPQHVNEDGSLKGTLCFAANLPTKIEVGRGVKMILKMLISVFTRLTRGATITMGWESADTLPAFTSLASHSLDALIETETLDAAPPLGVPMLPDRGDLARMRSMEKKGKCPFFNHRWYTTSFHSQYADFSKWAMVQVPGMSSVDLHRFWGDHPFRVGWYLLPPGEEMQTACSKALPLFRIEIRHESLPSFEK